MLGLSIGGPIWHGVPPMDIWSILCPETTVEARTFLGLFLPSGSLNSGVSGRCEMDVREGPAIHRISPLHQNPKAVAAFGRGLRNWPTARRRRRGRLGAVRAGAKDVGVGRPGGQAVRRLDWAMAGGFKRR